ncbi:MAG: NuoM family protein [Candidatus Dormibacteria bacterium]
MSGQPPWLTLVLVLPLLGAALIQLLPGTAHRAIQGVTVAATLVTAVIVAGLVAHLGDGASLGGPLSFHFEEHHDWIPAIGTSFHLGLDGLSSWLLALNAGLFLLAALAMQARSTRRPRFFCTLLLLTETATAGVLLSVDLLLFYLFWEAVLIPLYLILSGYGGADRGRATLKFVVYTVAGSLLMLLSIIYLAVQSGTGSFDLQTLLLNPSLDRRQLLLPFVAFALAFAIKVPLVPFHTWLPDLYASAPPAVLIFLAGIVSKLGAYGLIRYGLTLFPGTVHDLQWLLTGLAILSIIYGALMALAERDIKRIVAYASVSHLGFVCLGIFALNANGINGAILQMVNHGIVIAALFLVVGVIEAHTGTRDRHELSGLERRMPWLYALFLVVTLAALGMPGMGTFAGEFTIMLGAFQVSWVLAALAGAGVVLACWYMLRLHQGLMHEPPRPRTEQVTDIHLREGLLLAPLVGLMILLGMYPRPVGEVARDSVGQYVKLADGAPARPPSGSLPPAP